MVTERITVETLEKILGVEFESIGGVLREANDKEIFNQVLFMAIPYPGHKVEIQYDPDSSATDGYVYVNDGYIDLTIDDAVSVWGEC
jgi:hypothetical protein